MDDLISRQAAIDALDALCDRECEYSKKQRSVMCGACHLGSAFDVIEQWPSAQPEKRTDKRTETHACDSINRQAAIDAFEKELCDVRAFAVGFVGAKRILESVPSAQPEPKWIPVKTRPMTEDEREYWSEHYGYDIEYEYSVMFDCKMPKDKQAIWVQSKCGYVFEDICENDDGMIGLEGNGDWDDIVAWMPKYIPEPWRGEGNNNK